MGETMHCYLLLCALLLAADLIASDANRESCLEQADACLDAGLFEQALPLYMELLEKQEGTDLKLLFSAAQACYKCEKYERALTLLEKLLAQESCAFRPKVLHLAALTSQNQGNYSTALSYFQEYLALQSDDDQTHFQLGLLFFLWDKPELAKEQFRRVAEERQQPRLSALAGLYLVRIFLAEGKPRAALDLLNKLEISPDDVLRYELAYLKGEYFFAENQFEKAVEHFLMALPATAPEKCSWYADLLYRLGNSYLKISSLNSNGELQKESLLKAQNAFKKLFEWQPNERACLSLAESYLLRAKLFREDHDFFMAEQLLARTDLLVSQRAQMQALLLRADATPAYAVRNALYQQLTEDSLQPCLLQAECWYKRGLNDYHEALTDLEKSAGLHSAASCFKRGFELFQSYGDKRQAAACKIMELLALSHLNTSQAWHSAMRAAEELMTRYSETWHSMEHPEQILYLHGFFAACAADKADCPEARAADASLKKSADFSGSTYGETALKQLAAMHYRIGNRVEAEKVYLEITERYPNAPICSEAWYWAACCAESLGKPKELSNARRVKAFESFPDGPCAAEAFFTLYTFQDYLQGDRTSIKHLLNFVQKYPLSPLAIDAHYLIGLDYKRDRKTPEGKWIRKKNLPQAIDALQTAETLHEELAQQLQIPAERSTYYSVLGLRATLERAKANQTIAEESQGAKRQIYLEYAEEVYKQLLAEIKRGDPGLAQHADIYEESAYGLAQTEIKLNRTEQAEQVLDDLLEYYRQKKTLRGYYLSRTWYEKAWIAMRSGKFDVGLERLKQAEDAAQELVQESLLGTDQKLDLWIQQSICCREMGKFEEAILLLSQTVNDDSVSALRLKAMFMRAEIYERQGRPELARKQLESLAKKGGSWGMKAKKKLEEDYGY
jgi:tetratricopeptide (TPR) repeat protein